MTTTYCDADDVTQALEELGGPPVPGPAVEPAWLRYADERT